MQMTKPWQAATAPPALRATTAWVSPMTSNASALCAHWLVCYYCDVAHFVGRQLLVFLLWPQALWRICSVIHQQLLSRQSQPGQCADCLPAGMLLCLCEAGMLPVRASAHFSTAKYRWPPRSSARLPKVCAEALTSTVIDKLHNGLLPTAGCSEALGDEKVASASEFADNECCIGDEDAVDILMSLRDGGMQVGLPSDAVAVCVAQIVITSAAWHCTCVPAHCSGIWQEASGKKPHHSMPP